MYKRDWNKDWEFCQKACETTRDCPPCPAPGAVIALPYWLQRFKQIDTERANWKKWCMEAEERERALVKQAREYRKMLEYVIDCIDFCPVCGQDKPGHKEECELSALLSQSKNLQVRKREGI